MKIKIKSQNSIIPLHCLPLSPHTAAEKFKKLKILLFPPSSSTLNKTQLSSLNSIAMRILPSRASQPQFGEFSERAKRAWQLPVEWEKANDDINWIFTIPFRVLMATQIVWDSGLVSTPNDKNFFLTTFQRSKSDSSSCSLSADWGTSAFSCHRKREEKMRSCRNYLVGSDRSDNFPQIFWTIAWQQLTVDERRDEPTVDAIVFHQQSKWGWQKVVKTAQRWEKFRPRENNENALLIAATGWGGRKASFTFLVHWKKNSPTVEDEWESFFN